MIIGGTVTATVEPNTHPGYLGWVIVLSDPNGFTDVPGLRTSARAITLRGAERRAMRMVRKVRAERAYQHRRRYF